MCLCHSSSCFIKCFVQNNRSITNVYTLHIRCGNLKKIWKALCVAKDKQPSQGGALLAFIRFQLLVNRNALKMDPSTPSFKSLISRNTTSQCQQWTGSRRPTEQVRATRCWEQWGGIRGQRRRHAQPMATPLAQARTQHIRW